MHDPAPPVTEPPTLTAWPGTSTYHPDFGKGRWLRAQTPRHRLIEYRIHVEVGWYPDIATAQRHDLAAWAEQRREINAKACARWLRRQRALPSRRWQLARGAVFAWPRRCVYCGAPARHADHIVPISQGGSDDYDNLAPACGRCNIQKGGRTPEQWRAWREARGQCWPPAGAIHTREAVAA